MISLRHGSLVGLLVVVGLLSHAMSPAAVWRVSGDGTGDFLTINAAISAASPGDTIRVGPGAYQEETIDLLDSLRLVAEQGAIPNIRAADGSVQINMAESSYLGGFEIEYCYIR